MSAVPATKECRSQDASLVRRVQLGRHIVHDGRQVEGVQQPPAQRRQHTA
jgi:hypothetical protein